MLMGMTSRTSIDSWPFFLRIASGLGRLDAHPRAQPLALHARRLYLGTDTHDGGDGDPLSGQLVDTLVIGPEAGIDESSDHFYRAR
jgi:hypothetical protein